MRCLKCDKPCPKWVRTLAQQGVKEDQAAGRGGHGVTGGGGGRGGRGGHGVTGSGGGRGGRGGYGVTGHRSARVADNTFGTYLHAAQHGQQAAAAAAKIAQLQKELKAAHARAQVPPLSTAADVGAMAKHAEAAGHGPEVVASLKAAAAKAETAAKEAASAKSPQERYLEASETLEHAEAAREKQERALLRIQAAINKQQERFDKAQVELGRLRTQSAAAKEEYECAVRALPGAASRAGALASSLDATQAVALALGPTNVRSEVVAMPELQLILDEFRKAYEGKVAGIELIERANAERQEAAAAASQSGLPGAAHGEAVHEDVTLVVASDASTGPEPLAAPPQPTLPSAPTAVPFKLSLDPEQLHGLFAGKEIKEIAMQVNSLAEAHALQPPPPPNALGEDRHTPYGGGSR